MNTSADRYQDIRDAVRALCAGFPDEYHRKVDEQRAYPEAFVDALTQAGWLAALIPQEYGGSGLGLTEASVIMEEINRSGGNSGACHGQMYNMGTLLRHGCKPHPTWPASQWACSLAGSAVATRRTRLESACRAIDGMGGALEHPATHRRFMVDQRSSSGRILPSRYEPYHWPRHLTSQRHGNSALDGTPAGQLSTHQH